MRSMSNSPFRACLLISLLGLGSALPRAEVKVYPAPPDEPLLSSDYRITVDGRPVDAYRQPTRTAGPSVIYGQNVDYGGPYSFANFDMSGSVEVRIVTRKSLANVRILPASLAIRHRVAGDTLLFTLARPAKVIIEPDWKRGPLCLFANPMEINPPKQGDPGVVYFAPGIHHPGVIRLRSNQILYLAGGAVVRGALDINGDNIKVRGRGILCGNDWEHFRGPASIMVYARGTNHDVEGITLRGSWAHTFQIHNSRKVVIRNVKICGGRVENDDGFQPASSDSVHIEDVFVRSDDDCIAMKGYDFNTYVQNVTVRNSVFWCDRARIVLMGHESRAIAMRKILIENIDVLHYVIDVFLLEPGEDMLMEDVVIRNVRINADGDPWHTQNFITLRPLVNQYMQRKVPGRIRNILFQNIALTGRNNDTYGIWVKGETGNHGVENVTFENVTRFGEPVTLPSRNVKVEGNTADIRFTVSGSTAIRPERSAARYPRYSGYRFLRVGLDMETLRGRNLRP